MPALPNPYADLNPGFAANLQQFFAAAPAPLSIVSGYRSPEHQATLWNNAVAKYGSPEAARRWVAPPGMSMHNRGMAADLGYGGGGLGSGNADLINWAHENAGHYGLTFPLSNENWHIEPLGARAQARGQLPSQPAGMDTPSPQAATDAASPGNLPPAPPSLGWMDLLDPSQRQAPKAALPDDPLARMMGGGNPLGFSMKDNPIRSMMMHALGSLFV